MLVPLMLDPMTQAPETDTLTRYISDHCMLDIIQLYVKMCSVTLLSLHRMSLGLELYMGIPVYFLWFIAVNDGGYYCLT